MKVLVLGSGVIGTTTAYFLARAGAEVTVLDRQSGPAMETSFANAGQVSPGYSTPWAAPGIPLKALKWLFQKHAPLSLRPDGSLFQLRWLLSMLAQCNGADYATNKERMMRLSEYSRDCLRQLRADTGIAYEHRTGGTLQVFRKQAQLDAVARDIEVLKECGVPFELLDREGLLKVEPGLHQACAPREGRLLGGLRLPNDETGDCRLFTLASPAYLSAHGQPLHPEQLRHHECLIYSMTMNAATWSYADAGQVSAFAVRGRIRSNNGVALTQAAAEGLGITRQQDFIAEPFLARGEVVELLQDFAPPVLGIYAVLPSNRYIPHRVNVLIEHLAKSLRPV